MAEHPLGTMMKIDPQFMEHLKSTDELVYNDGALPRKIKLLIALAFDAANGADMGVKSLAIAAQKAGAAKEEIAEVLRVTFHLTGIGCLYTASQGLKDLF